jgi:hypothetical protein
VSGELENTLAIVAPEIGVPLKVLRYIVDGVVIVALVVGLGYVIWKVFFAQKQAELKSQQVQTQLQTGLGTAAQQSGQQAVKITVDNQTHAAGIDRETQKAINELLKAPGANTLVDPAMASITRRAICMRASASSLSSCRQLLDPGP